MNVNKRRQQVIAGVFLIAVGLVWWLGLWWLLWPGALAVAFAHADEKHIALLMHFLSTTFPEITSLQYVINRKQNDTIYDLEVITFAGSDAIFEYIGDLKFRISAKSFFQTNTRQAARLYHCVREFAGLKGSELVYDLYTGTGSIALYLARYCKKVIGIEQVEQAIQDARINASINQITNVEFYTADIAKVLDHTQGDKIRVSQFKAKARHRRTIGFRAQLTKVEIIGLGKKEKTAQA